MTETTQQKRGPSLSSETFRTRPKKCGVRSPKAALIEQWLMKNDFQPAVGHRFKLRMEPMGKLGRRGSIAKCWRSNRISGLHTGGRRWVWTPSSRSR